MIDVEVCVIGGASVDIISKASGETIKGNSNPGEIRLQAGGSGRNCCECLARLGIKTLMVSAISSDTQCQMQKLIRKSLQDVGAQCKLIEQKGFNTASYNVFLQADGEQLLGISDMKVIEQLKSEELSEIIYKVQKCRVLVMDSNLSVPQVHQLLLNIQPLIIQGMQVVFEPISIQKQTPFINILHLFTLYKPNMQQFLALINKQPPINILQEAQNYLQQLKESREDSMLTSLLVTDGGNGCYYVNIQTGESEYCKASAVETVESVVGAGDSFLAGFIAFALRSHYSPFKQLCFAHLCATYTIQSTNNVSTAITPSLLHSI